MEKQRHQASGVRKTMAIGHKGIRRQASGGRKTMAIGHKGFRHQASGKYVSCPYRTYCIYPEFL
ncbi:MAG: hypothetical protein ACM3NR_04345 [Methanosarcina sp.]